MITTPFDAQVSGQVDQFSTNYLRLGVHPVFREIVESMDGWSRFVEVKEATEQLHFSPGRGRWDDQDAAMRVVRGESLEAVAAERASHDQETENIRHLESMRDAVVVAVSSEAQSWVNAHVEEIAAAVDARLEVVRAGARELLAGKLSALQSAADLERHPELAGEWVAFHELAATFSRLADVADLLAPVTRTGWPASGLVAPEDYPKIWPSFYLGREPLGLQQGVKFVGEIPQVDVPWHDRGSLLRAVALSGARFNIARTPHQLAKRQTALNEASNTLRDERNAREVAA